MKKNEIKLRNILEEIDLDKFLIVIKKKHEHEKKLIKETIKTVISSLIHDPKNTIQNTNYILDFLDAIWKKYNREEIVEIFKGFITIEPALLSLANTRDHFLHIFHVFLLGLRIISQIISKTGDESKQILKIKDEGDEAHKFSHSYNYKERVFYIWTLASTFHDIGYLLEQLSRIEKKFQDFLDICKYSITPLSLKLNYTDIIELEDQFKLISGLYGGNLEFETINNNISVYKKVEHRYFYKVLVSAFRERDHGILSSIILLRVIEDIFLFPKEDFEYKFTPKEFNNYIKNIYNNDVIRMALIISLHNLNKDKIPPIPKIKFSEFPLAFILIFTDNIQEFLRGRIYLTEEKIILRKIPDIDVNFEHNILSITIKYNLDHEEIIEIKEKTKIDDLKEALREFWHYSTKTLDDRLKCGSKYEFILEMWKDSDIVYKWALK